MTQAAHPITSSELAARALSLPLLGSPHKDEPCQCSMCAKTINPGDLAGPLVTSNVFTNWLDLTPATGMVCGFCLTTKEQSVMRFLQRSVITAKGIYPISKDENRAWFLLTPPEPPFSVVVSTGAFTAAFHLHWRTPVTLSKDLINVRIDDIVSSIRRPVLERAIAASDEMVDLLETAQKAKAPIRRGQPPKRAPHPFMALDRSLGNPNHGRLKPQAVDAAKAAGRQDLVHLLMSLTPAETWALATLIKTNRPEPIKPDLITSTAKTTAAQD